MLFPSGNSVLELLAGVERNDPAGGNRDFLAGLRITSGTLGFVAQLEIPKAGQLDAAPGLKSGADLSKKSIHERFALALGQPRLLKKNLDEVRLGHGVVILHNDFPF